MNPTELKSKANHIVETHLIPLLQETEITVFIAATLGVITELGMLAPERSRQVLIESLQRVIVALKTSPPAADIRQRIDKEKETP